MPEFTRSTKVSATQWNKNGDHPAVRSIPSEDDSLIEQYGSAEKIEEGVRGFVSTPRGERLVNIGDWIVGEGDNLSVYTDEAFSEIFK